MIEAQLFAPASGDCLEQFIARVLAVGIVDRLEAVDVDVGQREALAPAAAFHDRR